MQARRVLVDAGGFALPDGRHVRPGHALRVSGGLTRAEELVQLEDAGLVQLVDLRGDDEDRLILERWAAGHGVGYAQHPIRAAGMAEIMASARDAPDEAAGRAFQRDLYMLVVDGFAPAFAATLAALAGPGPVGFGCAAGKDRTGIVTAFLHRLLGLSEQEAAAAYARLAPTPEQLRPLAEAQGHAAGAELPPGMVAMLGAPAALMLAVFARVRETHGGLEAYLEAAGFPADGAERLRERLLA